MRIVCALWVRLIDTLALKCSLRMGFAFALAAVGSLTGTPIDGALLGDAFTWSRTIIFSGVRAFPSLTHSRWFLC